jgi:hypothetical protein
MMNLMMNHTKKTKKMLKFVLKRKITDAKFRFLKRKAKRSEEVITDNPVWGKTISFQPIQKKSIPDVNKLRVIQSRPRQYRFDRNKPVGKKYLPALYEYKSINVWQAERMAEEFRKKKQFGKLKRLYKIQPEIDPVNIRKKEHEEKVRKWKEKLHKNHVQQCQSLK